MTGIASGLVRTNRTDWRKRFCAKCQPSSAPLAAEPLHCDAVRECLGIGTC